MKSVIKLREKEMEGLSPELINAYLERDKDKGYFELKKREEDEKNEEEVLNPSLEYFGASLLETISNSGDINNCFKIYNPDPNGNDSEIPKDSLYSQLHHLKGKSGIEEDETQQGPKVMFCITMFQENWSKVAQSLVGCIRNLFEMHALSKSEGMEDYDASNSAIILYQDGIDKLSSNFEKNITKFGLFDPELCKHTVVTRENFRDVKRKFGKMRSTVVSKEEVEEKNRGGRGYEVEAKVYEYGTKNISHIFASKITPQHLKTILSSPDTPRIPQIPSDQTPYSYCTDPIKHLDQIPEIRFFLCLKHEHSNKIESQKLFFKGFCDPFKPSYCQLLNCGVIPKNNSITTFVKYLDLWPYCGGVTGEQEVLTPGREEMGYEWVRKTKRRQVEDLNKAERYDQIYRKKDGEEGNVNFELKDRLLKLKKEIEAEEYIKISDSEWYQKEKRNFYHCIEAYIIIYAQYLEYKLDFYLNKCFESFFGYATILPTAFCMFRWKALQGEPLKDFYKGMEKEEHTAREANIYIAQDRILCFGILKKYSASYVLRFLPCAVALTDAPESIVGLIKQRRRWTNSSLFTSGHIIDNFGLICRSKHHCCRKMIYSLLYLYNLFNFLFTLILVGSFYASFAIFTKRIFDKDDETCNRWSLERSFDIVYTAFIFVFCAMGLTKPVERSGYTYSALVFIFCILVCGGFGTGLIYFLKDDMNIYSIAAFGAAIFCYYIGPFVTHFWRFNWLKYFVSFLILFLLTPLYVIVIMIFSISNVQDINWGKRTNNDDVPDGTRKNLEQFRAIILLIWISINALYGYSTLFLEENGQNYLILVLSILVAAPLIIKFIFATVYYWMYYPCYVKYAMSRLESKRKWKAEA